MNVHMNRATDTMNDENGEAQGEIDIGKMKRYIAYCKA
jgi:DNA replication licensing factor MCM5